MANKFLHFFGHFWSTVTIPLVFLLFVLPGSLIAAPLPLKLRVGFVRHFWQIFARYTLTWGCFCQVYTEDHRPSNLKSYPYVGLYIANHQSYMDIPLMLSQYQIPPIMKKEVLYIPIIGFMGWASGALAVSRGKRDSRKRVFIKARERLVQHRFALQYYPEGTRSKDGQPKPYDKLKVTLIHLAFSENIPVIPVSMYGTNQVLSPKGLIRYGKKVAIKTHTPLYPKDFSNANEFARACWQKVIAGHAELAAKLSS
jgi:1-acyl-sn-glycerol-3-phosphate acyltransferase